MVRVFLSHAADADGAARERLAADLRAAGIDLWMAPDSIIAGESFPAAIDRGLANSDYFVALLSPASLASRWVQAEVNAAITRALDGKLTILPVVVSGVAVPPLLSTFQQIDLTNYEEGLARLADAIGVSLRSVTGIAGTEATRPGRQIAPVGPQDALVANVRADLERGARRFHYIVQRAPSLPGSVVDSIVEVASLRIGVAVWPEESVTTGRMLAEIERELRTNAHRVAAVLGIASGESTRMTPFQLLDATSPNAMLLTWNESDGSDAIGASIDLVVRDVTGEGPPLSSPGTEDEGRSTSPRVYISYSWDSVAHKQRVLELSNALRGDGIESHLDQYEVGPPSWKQWQKDQVSAMDFVLMVCTEEYRRRVEDEPGRGAYTDGQLIQARLAANTNRAWLVAVGFGHYRDNRAAIPAFVGDTEYYNVGHRDGYKRLLARLLGQPLVVAPPVATPRARTSARESEPEPTDRAPQATAEPAPRVETKRSSVFVSYSHVDEKWLQRLQPHFESLRLEHPSFELWDDTRIQPGADWRQDIRTALASARVAVLLVSKSFLASKFIQNEELPQLLSSAQGGGTLLLAVLLSPSRFEHVDALARFQTVNPPSKTLAEMSGPERDRVFVKLTERIAGALKDG